MGEDTLQLLKEMLMTRADKQGRCSFIPQVWLGVIRQSTLYSPL